MTGQHVIVELEQFAPGSFAEHYRTSEHYAHFPQEHRSGGTFGLTLVDVQQGAGEFVDPPMQEIVFASGRHDADLIELNFGDGWSSHAAPAGWVDIQPARTECAFRLSDLHLRSAVVDDTALEARLDELDLNPSVLTSVTGEMRHLPRAASWIDRMWDASEQGGAAANLELDAAFLSLLAELLRACGDERLFAPVPSVGDRRIARVLDYVEAHLHTALTVGELAAIACVSVFHFGRVFRRETGTSPHAYVMERRVEQAKQLLATTDLSVTAIALSCGFASPSHLTDRFKRATGTGPAAWRTEVWT